MEAEPVQRRTVMVRGLPAVFGKGAAEEVDALATYMRQWGDVTHVVLARKNRAAMLRMKARAALAEELSLEQVRLYVTARRPSPRRSPQPSPSPSTLPPTFTLPSTSIWRSTSTCTFTSGAPLPCSSKVDRAAEAAAEAAATKEHAASLESSLEWTQPSRQRWDGSGGRNSY
mmetsp:Transcript_27403/g.55150  ORF Transcript_27403/g.55150 Transcript_27403/m.55150 type:complete len:172 (+) Transcript_27403:924-1439(+)